MSTEKFYLIVNRFVLEMILVAAMIMFFVGMKNANAVAPNEIWLELQGIEKSIADEFKEER